MIFFAVPFHNIKNQPLSLSKNKGFLQFVRHPSEIFAHLFENKLWKVTVCSTKIKSK